MPSYFFQCWIDSKFLTTVVTAQIALYFVQEQGESAEFTGVNEHFQHSYWTKQRAS
jgi:hypothetical protein